MAEVARRATDVSDLHVRTERRKSGIFFFNRSFKRRDSVPALGPRAVPSRRRTRLTKSRRIGVDSQGEPPSRGREFSSHLSLPLASNPPCAKRSSSLRSSSHKNDGAESSASTPTTPTMGPVKDAETDLKRTDSARSIPILAQTAHITAEAEPLSASPKSASESLAESVQKPAEDGTDKELSNNKATPSEGLPTPPDTPGPASTAEATAGEVQEEEATDPVSEKTAESTFPAELAGIEKRVEYHEDADLHIHARDLDGTEVVYSVRACVLETISRAWKENLATRASNVVDAVSDPAFGLDILFSIAHYRFTSLPYHTDLQALYDIAIAADRYQALHLLVPFVKSWLASLDPVTLTEEGTSIDKALVLSWILGDAQLFSKLLSKSAYQAQISPDGVLLDAAGMAWSSQPVSKEVLGLIAATRLDAIDEIIKAVSTPVNKLLNPQWYPEENTRYCHAPEDDNAREYCEQLQLGSAIMGLSKAKLWPPPEASRIRASASELAQSYKEIRMRRYQVPGLRFQEGEEAPADVHATCGFGHHGAIDEILGKPIPLFGSVVSELLAHAKTSGAFREALFIGFEEYLPAPAGQDEVQNEE